MSITQTHVFPRNSATYYGANASNATLLVRPMFNNDGTQSITAALEKPNGLVNWPRSFGDAAHEDQANVMRTDAARFRSVFLTINLYPAYGRDLSDTTIYNSLV